MKAKEQEIVDYLIIGAGLTGLTLAYLLSKAGKSYQILEARNRIGGRILSQQTGSGQVELGATWLGNKHIYLGQLLEELNLEVFEQHIGGKAIYEAISTSPPYLAQLSHNPEPSLRIKGGTHQIIQSLHKQLDGNFIKLNEQVKQIDFQEKIISIETLASKYLAKAIISTLPPNLMVNAIEFIPQIPAELKQIANNNHTWMGDSIKIALRFSEPFWKEENTSGTIMSNVGPIPEMYDHSNYEDSFYALKGFLNGNYFSLSKEERLELILNQLRKYYGSRIDNYLEYHELVWRKEKHTFYPYASHVLPHQNNGHAIFQQSHFGNRLHLAGAETSQHFSGYMEGAVHSANQVYDRLKVNAHD